MHRPAQVGQPQCEQETIGQHACGVPLLRHTGLPGLRRDSFVLADQSAEDRSSLDPLTGQVDQGMVGPWWLQVQRPVGSPPVVVACEVVEDSVSFADDEHPVGDLGPGGEHEPFRVGVRPRAAWRDLAHAHTGVGEHRVERGGELPGPVSDKDLELFGALAEIHQEIPDLLRSPRTVRVRGGTQDVHVPSPDLHDEEDVQSPQGHRAVDVEQVAGEDGRRLGPQETRRQVVWSRRVGAGGIPDRCRILRIVDVPTRWPRPSSSPRMRW